MVPMRNRQSLTWVAGVLLVLLGACAMDDNKERQFASKDGAATSRDGAAADKAAGSADSQAGTAKGPLSSDTPSGGDFGKGSNAAQEGPSGAWEGKPGASGSGDKVTPVTSGNEKQFECAEASTPESRSSVAAEGGANVRQEPSINGARVGGLDRGASVSIWKSIASGSETWMCVSGPSFEGPLVVGWVRSDLLNVIKEEGPQISE